MKKRRIFDIDLPGTDEDIFPAGKMEPVEPKTSAAGKIENRRSPMAAAITENAESLRERRALEEQIRKENDTLAAEHVRMKQLGLIVDLVDIDLIDTWKLVRDRSPGDDQELSELITSIRDLGLSNPIRVEQSADGRYELIQGYRRLSAYRALLAETGDATLWGKVPAGILPRGEDMEGLYRRMVDENMVRKDISFAEMAMLAMNYAKDPATKENDPDRVVAELFQSAGYQKRSYIRQFIRIMNHLDDTLIFASHIPRAMGLKLASAIEERPELITQIKAALKHWENRSISDELDVLRKAIGQVTDDELSSDAPAKSVAKTGKAKTTFQLKSRLGSARCTAANGRLEIKLERDFSAFDRRQLENALIRMLNDLE